jgi:hypothetical protein
MTHKNLNQRVLGRPVLIRSTQVPTDLEWSRMQARMGRRGQRNRRTPVPPEASPIVGWLILLWIVIIAVAAFLLSGCGGEPVNIHAPNILELDCPIVETDAAPLSSPGECTRLDVVSGGFVRVTDGDCEAWSSCIVYDDTQLGVHGQERTDHGSERHVEVTRGICDSVPSCSVPYGSAGYTWGVL